MLKKVSKLCLIAAITTCFSTQVMAADPEVGVSGEVEFGMAQTAEKDGATILDMDSSGSVAVEGSIEVGGWTTTGAIDFEFTADGFTPLNRILTVENNSLSIALGNFEYDADDIGMGKDYLGFVDESMGAFGSNALEDGAGAGGGDFAKVSLKETGLMLVVGINDLDDSTNQYAETALGAYYGGEFGDLALSAAILSVSEKVDKEQDATAVDGAHDGASKSEMAVAASYGLDKMAFTLNLDQYSNEAGDADDATKLTTIELAFDIGLGDDSGVTVAYGTSSEDDGSGGDKLVTTAINVGYARPFSGAILSIAYASVTEKQDDAGIDTAVTTVGAGLTFEF